MRDRERKQKEQKSIIIRTKKGNTVNCYHFTTYGRDSHDLPSGANRYATFDKAAERIEVNWNVGGDVFIRLYERHPNGFDVVDTVVFDKKFVTAIEIETDFKNLRWEDLNG
jgi:hypothetical protein